VPALSSNTRPLAFFRPVSSPRQLPPPRSYGEKRLTAKGIDLLGNPVPRLWRKTRSKMDFRQGLFLARKLAAARKICACRLTFGKMHIISISELSFKLFPFSFFLPVFYLFYLFFFRHLSCNMHL
jgi:hypothetical protein